jgi:hypothetical protein
VQQAAPLPLPNLRCPGVLWLTRGLTGVELLLRLDIERVITQGLFKEPLCAFVISTELEPKPRVDQLGSALLRHNLPCRAGFADLRQKPLEKCGGVFD